MFMTKSESLDLYGSHTKGIVTQHSHAANFEKGMYKSWRFQSTLINN